MSSPQLHLKKKLTNRAKSTKSKKQSHIDSQEMETFNLLIKDYNKHIQSNPRDFNAELPILQALGASNYDMIDNLD
jgi:hypothetical protein